jgi:MSHA biogenesis protein MshO
MFCGCCGRRSICGGFTLIELIMVIMITAILALVSSRFITLSVRGWLDQAGRHEMAMAAASASEKLGREVRQALPNSVRSFSDAGNTCLELVPVLNHSEYLSLPVTAAGSSFRALAFAHDSGAEQGYVAVYPYSSKAVYGNGARRGDAISASLASADDAVDHVQVIRFAATEQFPVDSPQRRFYLVDTPVAWCEDGAGGLWRYRGYGFAADSRSLLPTTGSQAELVINNLLPGSLEVTVDRAELHRNSVVRFSFSLLRSSRTGNSDGEAGEQLPLVMEVQLQNVP